jgi:hypothetical protein
VFVLDAGEGLALGFCGVGAMKMQNKEGTKAGGLMSNQRSRQTRQTKVEAWFSAKYLQKIVT